MISTLQAKDSTYDFSLLEDKQGKMKKESLRSKKRNLEAILGKSSTHMHGSGRICVQGLSHPRLGIPDQA
ncbi:hypothetical protein PIB30_093750 [Stylosanthes scabra]|uniref:Uncharacterized protein n=1 Tax=Stylosanthes scabra TaxID=79078 RepID=A0ABU6RVT4_9FABA|nr:hypothetical protein [Stylosanthes scabra]